MYNRTLRAKITNADQLDATLVDIQTTGGAIVQLFPFVGPLKGTTTGTGLDETETEMTVGSNFVVTYFDKADANVQQ